METKLARAPRKPGDRKRSGSSDKPRPTLAFRVNAALYKQIHDSARLHELSITEEIEGRLGASFAKGMIDPETQRLADLIAMSLTMNQAGMPKPWHEARHTSATRYLWKRASLLAARVMGVIPVGELHEDAQQQALDAERQAEDDNMREAATSDTLKGYFGAVLASTRPIQTAEELRSELETAGEPVEDHALTLEEEVEADNLMVEMFGDAPAEKPKRTRKAKPKA